MESSSLSSDVDIIMESTSSSDSEKKYMPEYEDFNSYKNIPLYVQLNAHHNENDRALSELQMQKGDHGGTSDKCNPKKCDTVFDNNCLYNETDFRNHFRMHFRLYNSIYETLVAKEPNSQWKFDVAHRCSIHPRVKLTACLRYLAYGSVVETLDEIWYIGIQTMMDTVRQFCNSILRQFGPIYLRSHTTEDVVRIRENSEARGWHGCLGSLDCMHWEWKNYPVGWRGQYQGHPGVATIVLEVVATHDTWIWHSLFGMAKSHNDLTVLDHSDLFDALVNGTSPPCDYVVNHNRYTIGYYLLDGIYPKYATLVQSILKLVHGEANQHFAKMQEGKRKDIERTFGILQGKWAIIERPFKLWSEDVMGIIMKTCILLHNMIVEDERDDDDDRYVTNYDQALPKGPTFNLLTFNELKYNTRVYKDHDMHVLLKQDLIQHHWTLKGLGRP